MLDLLRHYHGAAGLDEVCRLADEPKIPPCNNSKARKSNFRRLFSGSQDISDTLAARYLARRGIENLDLFSLHYHPCVWYRETGQTHHAPALFARVTDSKGQLAGLHRTWLDPDTESLAAISHPRKSLGHIKGHGVYFGMPDTILIVGEGIETVLSLKMARPDLSMAAVLSANNLTTFIIPSYVKLLIIAADSDEAGMKAAHKLYQRCRKAGLLAFIHEPVLADFNDDLRQFGVVSLRERLEARLSWV